MDSWTILRVQTAVTNRGRVEYSRTVTMKEKSWTLLSVTTMVALVPIHSTTSDSLRVGGPHQKVSSQVWGHELTTLVAPTLGVEPSISDLVHVGV
jgi:hypothetical protein